MAGRDSRPSNHINDSCSKKVYCYRKMYVPVIHCSHTVNGDIYFFPFSTFFSTKSVDLKASTISHFHTHDSPITSLYATETKQSDRDRLLLSGSRDGWVYMWDLEYALVFDRISYLQYRLTGQCFLQSFIACDRFRGFLSNFESQNQILVHVTSVWSLNRHIWYRRSRMVWNIWLHSHVSLYRLYGHEFEVERVYFKSPDDMIIIQCRNGKGYFWQLSTEHLERVISLGSNSEILHDCDSGIDCRPFYSGFQKTSAKKTVDLISLRTSKEGMFNQLGDFVTLKDTSRLFLFQMNTKRLIDEIYNGVQVLTPPTPSSLKANAKMARQNSAKDNPGSKFLHQLTDKFKKKKQVGTVEAAARQRMVTARGDKPDSDTIQTLFSGLMAWGLDIDVDNVCISRLGLLPTGRFITMGVRGYFLSDHIWSSIALEETCLFLRQSSTPALIIGHFPLLLMHLDC